MESDSLKKAVTEFLAAHCTLSLATADADGTPYAANVQYVSDDAWNLYWVSKAESAHSRHLVDRPSAALTIYAHTPAGEPDQIHGLQLRGAAVAMSDASEMAHANSRYTVKYPFTADPPFRDAVAAQTFYRFRPSWVRWIDNRRGFGWSVERHV